MAATVQTGAVASPDVLKSPVDGASTHSPNTHKGYCVNNRSIAPKTEGLVMRTGLWDQLRRMLAVNSTLLGVKLVITEPI